jgi:hypothetical protein
MMRVTEAFEVFYGGNLDIEVKPVLNVHFELLSDPIRA